MTDHAILPSLPFFLVGLFGVIILLIRFSSGLPHLARAFPRTGRMEGQRFWMQTLVISGLSNASPTNPWSGMNSSLWSVTIGKPGVESRMMQRGAFFFPNLSIAWSEIKTVESGRFLWMKHDGLNFTRAAGAVLLFGWTGEAVAKQWALLEASIESSLAAT